MISVCILAIGDELLNGSTADTNSQWIKETLTKFDASVVKSVNIPDNEAYIKNELDSCINLKYDFIIISGGLGPTHDDITKSTLSSYFKLPLIIVPRHHKFLLSKIKNKQKDDSIKKMIKSQSEIVQSFNKIDNKHGTALGMTGDFQGVKFFVLPGVPKELKQMVNDFIIPSYFTSSNKITNITFKTTGITESKLYLKLKKSISSYKQVMKLSFLPHFTGVNLRVSITANQHSTNKVIEELKLILGDYCYTEKNQTLSSVVSNLLIQKGITLSIAESCTGGMLSKRLTDSNGSSKYMIGSVIAYSNKIKNTILKVPNSVLDDVGAVSDKVAALMSENIKTIFDTDMGVSITGISGPSGGNKEKPVGLYYISVCYKNKTITKQYLFNVNDRGIHRQVASTTALNQMRLLIKELS